jgi:hypothetical protein
MSGLAQPLENRAGDVFIGEKLQVSLTRYS